MMIPNLNPGQKPTRPMSASLRTPRGGDPSMARLKAEGQATPRLRPTTEGQPTAEEDEPWLFSFDGLLSTGDVWRMGFSRLILLSAQARPPASLDHSHAPPASLDHNHGHSL